MTHRSRGPAIVALFVVALLLAGCGGTVIDAAKTEGAIEHNLETDVGQKVSSVECPSDVEVKAGETFTCIAKLEGGEAEAVKLKILNSDADVEILEVEPGKSDRESAK